MKHRLWPLGAVLLATLAASPTVAAAPPEDAEAHRRRGDEAANQGNLPEAIRAWKEAWAQTPTSDLACNVGRAELRSGDARAAAEWLTRCVRLSPLATERRELALQGEELRERDLAASRVATLTFDVEKGAEVFVDGARGRGARVLGRCARYPSPPPGAEPAHGRAVDPGRARAHGGVFSDER